MSANGWEITDWKCPACGSWKIEISWRIFCGSRLFNHFHTFVAPRCTANPSEFLSFRPWFCEALCSPYAQARKDLIRISWHSTDGLPRPPDCSVVLAAWRHRKAPNVPYAGWMPASHIGKAQGRIKGWNRVTEQSGRACADWGDLCRCLPCSQPAMVVIGIQVIWTSFLKGNGSRLNGWGWPAILTRKDHEMKGFFISWSQMTWPLAIYINWHREFWIWKQRLHAC